MERESKSVSRRDFLSVLTLGGTVLVGGCSNLPGDSSEVPEDAETATRPQTPTSVSTQTSPEANSQTVDKETETSNQETQTPQHPDEYVVDLKDPQGNNIGDTKTEREWDDHIFNRDALYEDYISGWFEEAVYDQVMEEISEKDHEKYNGIAAGAHYSNSEHNLGKVEEEGGYWDPEFYSDIGQLKYIIRDAQNVVRTHQRHVHPTAFSAWNNRFAPTLEKIVNTYNEHAQNYAGEEKPFYATHVNEREHGTVVTYADLENTDIEGGHSWQFVDTTSSTVAPVTESVDTRGVFNPYVDGYKSKSQTRLDYETEKEKAIGSLQSFVVPVPPKVNFDFTKLSMNDGLVKYIFNEYIPNGSSIKPLLEVLERATAVQLDT